MVWIVVKYLRVDFSFYGVNVSGFCPKTRLKETEVWKETENFVEKWELALNGWKRGWRKKLKKGLKMDQVYQNRFWFATFQNISIFQTSTSWGRVCNQATDETNNCLLILTSCTRCAHKHTHSTLLQFVRKFYFYVGLDFFVTYFQSQPWFMNFFVTYFLVLLIFWCYAS